MELYSDVAMATERGGPLLKGSAQAEKEIRLRKYIASSCTFMLACFNHIQVLH